MDKALEKDWASATWRGAEKARRKLDQQLSLRQKLEWNAQALALSLKLQRVSSEARSVKE